MNFYLSIAIGTGIVIVFIILLWLSISRGREKRTISIHDAALTCEELEEHAREIACDHVVSKRKNPSIWPLPRMNENYSFISSVYKSLNDDVQKKLAIPPAAEWLLDNFYIIEEQAKSIRRDLTKEQYSRLPALKSGVHKGYARVYAISAELVAHTNGQIDDNTLLNYIKAYQSHTVMSDREIWAMPAMIRLALIENIRYICEKLKSTQAQWRKADELVDGILEDDVQDAGKLVKVVEIKIRGLNEIDPSFIEHLCFRLRRIGRGYTQALTFIEDELTRHGTAMDSLTRKEHNTQAVNAVSIGNCILSLKFVSSLDWVEVFESSSSVEQILGQDPDGTYPLMDLPSRNYYRDRIEKLASLARASEMHVAKEAVELARQACAGSSKRGTSPAAQDDKRSCHVGYYLVGKGSKTLESKLGCRFTLREKIAAGARRHPAPLYIGSIVFITLLLSGCAMLYAFYAPPKYNTGLSLLSGIAALIPSSDMAVYLINWIICKMFKPGVFPRLELKDGIPEKLSSVVAIPALLPDEKRVKELLENLETHYLANNEKNLRFVLVGDFKDSPEREMPGDAGIVETALTGVMELNRKYSDGESDIFYYFHRCRTYNQRQQKWMGWERKRGALTEFNHLLLGAEDTSFCICSGSPKPFTSVKYVITLDADTVLPIDAAKKMIGTMAHPLNKPVADLKKGIVVDGYGLIQPKISVDVESGNKSLFSRIFTGQEGIDPYACAISDVYQDLFGEGIFTGKGIYDLRVFESILKNAIPENTVLSHDLLEGSYVRTGLCTDIELVDAYPSSYGSYTARMHRWVRGDWQLLPWLLHKVTNKNGKRIRNPLTVISRWKILDNLRRSLLSPSLMLLIALGFCVLPGSALFWLGFSVLTLAFSLLTGLIDYFSSWHLSGRVKRHMRVISGLKASALQVLLLFIFLPYQAYLMLNAICVTLVRVLFTKRNMLEWVTAADVEKGQKNSLRSFWAKMRISVLEGLLLIFLSLLFKPSALVAGTVLFVLWCISPVSAYRISRTSAEVPVRLPEEDLTELKQLARKTWRYFEEFVNFKNHYLPPDNYQEDPPNGIAYRTSPTNIGLGLMCALTARDLGYLGISEMTDIMSNTVSTMEKLEKWNGHLYNWYDTRTLEPLKPRYISTVDSGNLVCYLVTLVQGLNEYLERPLYGIEFADGIKTTVILAARESGSTYQGLEYLDNAFGSGTLDFPLWSRALDELSRSSNPPNLLNPERGVKKLRWRAKADHLVNSLKSEYLEFVPWAELLKKHEEYTELQVEDILNTLNSNIALKDLPLACQTALKQIDKALKAAGKGGAHGGGSAWLKDLREAVEKSIENTQRFIGRYKSLMDRIKSLADAMEFVPLYVEKKQLFSIGYNIEENRLTNSFYDLLASEARQTSYIAIARGEVPAKHWFKLGRTLTVVDSYKGLVSWTGTMFEYLMPLLLMKSYKNTLLDETYSFVLRSQKKYGRQRQVPWGASESGFYSLDINLDYQYKAIGVPWLGLKRGLIEDVVVAPYSTMLALPLDPACAMENIKRLKAEGLDGPYGLYEAVDYTPERLPFGLKRAVVKSFMVHHQGMSLLALNNFLNGNILQKRFHADPVIKAAGLLLQEKVPTSVVFTKETKEKVVPFKDVAYKEKGALRKFSKPDPILPKVHILSNGNYSVMITDRGTGYSRSKVAAITRWREDSTLDSYGMFFYIRNVDTDKVWSAAYSPFNVLPEGYEVTFTSDKAKFKRKDENIETITEIVVASGDNAEIRRISLKNRGDAPCVLEITSYFEVVLAQQGADIAHPAFSNLFVRTELLPEHNSIIANRKPRSESDKSLWIANKAIVEGETVGSVEYETDRMLFLGRGHTVSNPAAAERSKPLSGSSGPVLDPVMSLRLRISLSPGQTAKISYVAAVSESRESSLEFIEKYSTPESVESAFRLALTRSQVEGRYLNIKAEDMELYQDIISHIIFLSPLKRLAYGGSMRSTRGQSALWPYGISGDLPIVLLLLGKSDEIDILYEVLKAHEYWKTKDLRVDLAILNEEENSYTHPLRALLSDIVSSSHAHDILGKPGGVFVLNRSNMPEEDTALLYSAARLILKGNAGSLSRQTQVRTEPSYALADEGEISSPYPAHSTGGNHPAQHGALAPALDYFNGIGGFSPDGREYVIRLEKGQYTPTPWINVISNPDFGFIVSESGSGFTWSENSRENKLTPWSNDPVSDTPGEILYLGDTSTQELWSITPLPIREDEAYTAVHGFGYSVFEHTSHGIMQSMVQFVPVDSPVKLSIVKLKNTSGDTRSLKLVYYTRPVLGVSDQSTAMHILTSLSKSGALLVENPYNEEFPGRIMFVDASEKEHSVTGDRKEFFGRGRPISPWGLRQPKLSGTVGHGYDPCAAMQVNISLRAGEEKEIVFLLGMARDRNEAHDIAARYKNIEAAKKALESVKEFWNVRLGTVHVSTPDHSMDIMLNGWLLYQVISCRIWSRSAFYQSGGAYGFRDQLQDSLSAAQTWPQIARSQILLHARHQFVEGDVQHWWHEPAGKGTRTKFSDDLLWLPYVTAEYIKISGDFGILESQLPFMEDEILKEHEDERYSKPNVSPEAASLYEHCIRAIERSLKTGEHGIPLMGSGDWNDGMSTVGNRGKGESVWLGWFLYSVLMKFAPLCTQMGDEDRSARYIETAKTIASAIEENAWDGSWYRRAYFDNGMPLGSVQNSECKIDSISQSWAVISGAGRPERLETAMNSLENYLVQWDDGLIKLLTPAFDEGDLEPGYIKGYVPGVRENGGQYTHAAAWVIIAFAQLGYGDKALELFELINPINHTRTHIEYSRYKVEPYVMSADVYAVPPHVGRGGWTWYTGSAGWIYKSGLEYILGFRKVNDTLVIDPCIPKKWEEYDIRYNYLETVYKIKVKNPDSVSRGVKSILIDGSALQGNSIQLVNDRTEHAVEVIIGK